VIRRSEIKIKLALEPRMAALSLSLVEVLLVLAMVWLVGLARALVSFIVLLAT